MQQNAYGQWCIPIKGHTCYAAGIVRRAQAAWRKTFEAEYRKLKDGAVGAFVLGDLNVHSIRWLTYSARESAESRLLHDISDQLVMRQIVREPTRGKYLLDLVLTDVPDCTARPCAAVADHKGVLTQVTFKIPETATHQREVWHFGDADWE